MTNRVLVVDDEEQILGVLRPSLESAGYSVQTAMDGASALAAMASETIDVVILDLGLPDMDGKDIISHSAKAGAVPIIVLSARGSESEKIDALDRGAQDYIAKPFTVGELLARVRVALRPPGLPKPSDEFRSGHVHVEFARRRITIGPSQFRLSAREVELLRVLIGAQSQIVSHRQLIAAIWPHKADVDTQYVRVLVNQLRQKIEPEPLAANILVTEAGLGYRFGLPADPR